MVPEPSQDFIMWETRPAGGVTEIDWRDIDGASFVTGVRDQMGCGSCWVFGALAIVESARMIALGEPANVLEFARLAGVPPEACNPYESTDQLPCHTACPTALDQLEKIDQWGFVTVGSGGSTPERPSEADPSSVLAAPVPTLRVSSIWVLSMAGHPRLSSGSRP